MTADRRAPVRVDDPRGAWRADDFDFALPEALIALRPAQPRRSARLLAACGPDTKDARVEDLPGLLRPGDLLVFNDTRVIAARLSGRRVRASPDGSGVARIEATLLRRLGPDCWQALARPAKRLRPGDALAFGALCAAVAAKGDDGLVTLAFDRAGEALDAAIAVEGAPPLPPYIAARRAPDDRDVADYQTVFATHDGSVAAPTAALHFDDTLLAALAARGVLSARLTLHVGGGTFLPMKADALDDHRMHAEWGEIGAPAADAINAALRLLESAATPDGRIAPWRGETDIFIRPGHVFRGVDGLMTNFHLPRSTLFVLVSALMGVERMKALYAHAIAARYRFYSYGDSSLLMPQG